MEFGVETQHPDEFVSHLITLDRSAVCLALKHQRANLKNPPRTAEELLDTLEQQGLPLSVSQLCPPAWHPVPTQLSKLSRLPTGEKHGLMRHICCLLVGARSGGEFHAGSFSRRGHSETEELPRVGAGCDARVGVWVDGAKCNFALRFVRGPRSCTPPPCKRNSVCEGLGCWRRRRDWGLG